MCCLALIVGLILPRLALVLLWLLSDWLTRAFDNWVLPVVGFIILPYTTLAYVVAVNVSGGQPTVLWWIIIGVAVLVDVGNVAGGYGRRRR